PAAGRVVDLLAAVDDSQLGDPTPCPDTTVGDLIDHIGTLAVAFAAKAQNRDDVAGGPPPRPNAANLEPGWQDRIARDVDALAAAWREPSAWVGVTTAGGWGVSAEVGGARAVAGAFSGPVAHVNRRPQALPRGRFRGPGGVRAVVGRAP